jgi:uncharacterized protein (UPF0179 family)
MYKNPIHMADLENEAIEGHVNDHSQQHCDKSWCSMYKAVVDYEAI